MKFIINYSEYGVYYLIIMYKKLIINEVNMKYIVQL